MAEQAPPEQAEAGAGGGQRKKKKGQNVKIFARVRQLMPWEPRKVSLEIHGKKIRNTYGKKSNEYTFQNTYEPEITNEDIFKSMVRPMIENVLDGFNAILIAYGQTGSGKTYSMLGKPHLNIVGLLPQMLGYLLEQPQVRSVELSAVEAFGHHVARIELYDLFDPRNQIQVWTDKIGSGSLNAQAATRVQVQSYNDALDKIAYAHHGSHFAPTGKNPESSRGHVTFVAKVTADHPTVDHADVISYFIMVDCAGSEGESAFTPDFVSQVDKTTLMARRLEAGVINTGLSQLQIIFNELRVKGSLSKMVGNGLRRVLHPYINTKTFLSVLFTLSPSANNAKPTESTLKFAVAAGMVKVRPVKAEAKMNLDSLVAKLKQICDENDAKISAQNERLTDLGIELEQAKQASMSSSNRVTYETEEATEKPRRRRQPRAMAGAVSDRVTVGMGDGTGGGGAGHGRAESSLPMGLLMQLASMDEPSSSEDDDLDEMFVVGSGNVDAGGRGASRERAATVAEEEMLAAIQEMNQRNEASEMIRSVLDLPQASGNENEQLAAAAKATQATLAAGTADIGALSGLGDDGDDDDDDDDAPAGLMSPRGIGLDQMGMAGDDSDDDFVDLVSMNETDVRTYTDNSWVKIEEKRVEQDNLRATQKTVVDHLMDTNEWLFAALKEVLDSSVGQ